MRLFSAEKLTLRSMNAAMLLLEGCVTWSRTACWEMESSGRNTTEEEKVRKRRRYNSEHYTIQNLRTTGREPQNHRYRTTDTEPQNHRYRASEPQVQNDRYRTMTGELQNHRYWSENLTEPQMENLKKRTTSPEAPVTEL
ncbi:hypothetical protein EYF80_064223 [Liparis tanakae]|uniref:Uncharacterized protein n=1 Tax=Liparis tanakae TaxID=230148 RepID=A0A4Z2E9V4_9TELE|nr:hypothetical protein EYF80_064223 [Liparis tanakae]